MWCVWCACVCAYSEWCVHEGAIGCGVCGVHVCVRTVNGVCMKVTLCVVCVVCMCVCV